jgi:hypothetical protein
MPSMIAFNKLMKAQNTIPIDECWIGPSGDQIEGWIGLFKNPS